ncbi:MAG: hypothetical protein RMK99_06405 [Anaerolineales bacterium]|nr:hypothetical protein [Anaerolineales bacterium]
MQYPKLLCPVAYEECKLISGPVVRLPKATSTFRRWRGVSPIDTYGSKPIIDIDGSPGYAELAILKLLQKENWQGVWIDTFRKVRRSAIDICAHLPPDQDKLLEKIYTTAGTKSGCFDVFCWRPDGVLFVEAKQKGRDRIRQTQIRWLSAALQIGIPIGSFLVVEWQAEDG